MASADIETPENKELHADHNSSLSTSPEAEEDHIEKPIDHPEVPLWRITISLLLLFINYFLAQYDKFILSYFQDDVISSLHLSQASYGILSGYATGIVYALLALPTAFIADYTGARVWVLSVAATWWSLCALFQGLSHNFWQILLARIGMGIGQAPVEALSVSLISDLMGKRYVFFGESVLYVGVYVGEAISGQIATAFTASNTPWNTALIAIGIVGIVVAVFVRLLVREPRRQTSLIHSPTTITDPQTIGISSSQTPKPTLKTKLSTAHTDLKATTTYLLHMRSFWLLTLSASFRQLAGNVFGYYMPTYLSTLYSATPTILSRYGIIVGVVGSVSVLLGGLLTSLFWPRTKLLPLYLTAIGGFISSLFVLLMLFSRKLAGGNEEEGVRILYGVMSGAYLSAELWLGAVNSLIALILPPQYKTFGLAIWAATQVLIYSAGPEIVGLSIRGVESGSGEYLVDTRVALAVIIPVGYWVAGVGFLLAVPLVKRDLNGQFVMGRLSRGRRGAFGGFAVCLGCVVVVLFVLSIVFRD